MTKKNWCLFIQQVFNECLLHAYHYEKCEYIKKNIKNMLKGIIIYIKLKNKTVLSFFSVTSLLPSYSLSD